MAQVLGYVTPAERDAFEAYAHDHGLDVTALANLLIARELKAKRLEKLLLSSGPGEALSVRAKIVAHTPSDATKAVFAIRAAQAGVKPSRAAAILFRTELEERWLERHVLVNQIDST
jgi:hypothetical protein